MDIIFRNANRWYMQCGNKVKFIQQPEIEIEETRVREIIDEGDFFINYNTINGISLDELNRYDNSNSTFITYLKESAITYSFTCYIRVNKVESRVDKYGIIQDGRVRLPNYIMSYVKKVSRKVYSSIKELLNIQDITSVEYSIETDITGNENIWVNLDSVFVKGQITAIVDEIVWLNGYKCVEVYAGDILENDIIKVIQNNKALIYRRQ